MDNSDIDNLRKQLEGLGGSLDWSDTFMLKATEIAEKAAEWTSARNKELQEASTPTIEEPWKGLYVTSASLLYFYLWAHGSAKKRGHDKLARMVRNYAWYSLGSMVGSRIVLYNESKKND